MPPLCVLKCVPSIIPSSAGGRKGQGPKKTAFLTAGPGSFPLDNVDIREYTESGKCRYSRIGVRTVPRPKFQTLTEQMYYVLLCLNQECCGMDIMERIPAMTGGRVQVGSGTLYNLLEEFVQAGMIRQTRAEGRRRSYVLTDRGREALSGEYRRICALAWDYRAVFGEEGQP